MKIKKGLVWVLFALALVAGAIWAGNKVGRKLTSEMGLNFDELKTALVGQYESYHGVIGEDSVTLYLSWQREKVSGYCWKERDSLPLVLWGEGLFAKRSRVSALEQDILNPAFRNEFYKDSIDGVYRDATGKLSAYNLIRQKGFFESVSQTSTRTGEVEYSTVSNYFWPGKKLTDQQKINWLSALANSSQIKSIEAFDKYQEQLMLARKSPDTSKIERTYHVAVIRYDHPYLSVIISDRQKVGNEVTQIHQYLTYDLQEEKRLSIDDVFKPGYEDVLRQQLLRRGSGKKLLLDGQWPDFYITPTHLVFLCPFQDEEPGPVAVPLQTMLHWLKA